MGAAAVAAATTTTFVATVTAAEQLHLVGNDFGGVGVAAFLVLPLAGLEAAFHVDGAALAQVFTGNLGQAVIEDDAVPFGLFLALAGLAVLPVARGGNGDGAPGAAVGVVADLGVAAQVADEDDLLTLAMAVLPEKEVGESEVADYAQPAFLAIRWEARRCCRQPHFRDWHPHPVAAPARPAARLPKLPLHVVPAAPPTTDSGWLCRQLPAGLALYVLAGSEFDRGLDPFWLAVYQATTTLWAPALLGVAVWPLTRRLYRRPLLPFALGHLVGALSFGLAWLVGEYLLNSLLSARAHTPAPCCRRCCCGAASWAWRCMRRWRLPSTRCCRAARRGGGSGGGQAEAALAKAELAAISGKLNPHFLFNTLNSLIALARTDAAQAEQALLFASMLRYVLDTKRSDAAVSGQEPRVLLADEVTFLRDYLALEQLRLGERLRVDWQIDDAVLADELPPLTLQPLVENAVQHGVAPRKVGGCVTIRAARDRDLGRAWPPAWPTTARAASPPASMHPMPTAAKALASRTLRKRFSLDWRRPRPSEHPHRPGAGFRVDLWIPQT